MVHCQCLQKIPACRATDSVGVSYRGAKDSLRSQDHRLRIASPTGCNRVAPQAPFESFPTRVSIQNPTGSKRLDDPNDAIAPHRPERIMANGKLLQSAMHCGVAHRHAPDPLHLTARSALRHMHRKPNARLQGVLQVMIVSGNRQCLYQRD